MSRPYYALALLLALCWLTEARSQSLLAPEAGLLVLRNGQILKGNVLRAGDYYVVTFGENGEVRLPAADVEAFCGSLEEAFEFRQRHPQGTGVTAHIDLAEWCLRHGLHKHCGEELALAARIEPEHPRLILLQRRLQLALETPPPPAPPTKVAVTTVSADQLEARIRELPPGTMEKFAGVVQPILLNRCGANQCHGPNARSDFRMLRPSAGQLASRRFTQRNLYAALAYLDPSNPENSPLLIMPQRQHGTALTAVFDKHSQRHLDELTAWVNLALRSPQAPAPSTINSEQATLSQAPAAQTAPAASAGPADNSTTADGQSVQVMRPASDAGPDKRSPNGDRFVPRDPFDPEIFNRRFHKP